LVFIISESAENIRWSEWRKMGGRSLSMQAEAPIRKYYYNKRQIFESQNPTLKEIGRISKLAELEIARFAHENLKRDDLVVPESSG